MDSESPAPTTVGKRRSWLWPILTFAVMLIVVASDERDHLQHLADFDKGAAAAVGSVSIYSLYTDYSDRIDSCDYKWLVVCEAKPDQYSPFVTSAPQESSGGIVTYVAGAIVNLPKLPDATIHALIVRFRQGWAPFILSVTFLLLCIAFIIGALQEKNYLGAFFVPIFMLFAMWAIKHVFLLFAHGALLLLEALILVGGIPTLLAVSLKLFHESRELKEGVAEVVHTIKR